jgi:RHS repeat-associated protein
LLLTWAQTGATVSFIHVDHLGTPVKITDADQQVVWSATSEPFGDTTVAVAIIENNLRFPGQYFDAESGNHYNYFRDYEPTTGRYLQSDPIGLAGGLNTYGYALNNPLRNTDRRGLSVTGQWITYPTYPFPEFFCNGGDCLDYTNFDLNDFPFPILSSVEVSGRAASEWELECTDTCSGETKTFDGNVVFRASDTIHIPAPFCAVLPHPRARQICAAGMAVSVAHSITRATTRISEEIRRQYELALRLQFESLDPNVLCRGLCGDGR